MVTLITVSVNKQVSIAGESHITRQTGFTMNLC